MKLISLFTNYKPVCLFTYETASSRCRVIELGNITLEMDQYVTKYFGSRYCGNKITILLKSIENHSALLYATFCDGELSIGTSVHYLKDINKPGNAYLTIFPNSERRSNAFGDKQADSEWDIGE